jgi:hypothetical protein
MNTMLSEALQGFLGLLKQLLTNLLGNDAELWGNELKKFLRKEVCWPTNITPRRLATWKTIKIGTYASVEDLAAAFEGDNFFDFTHTAQNLLERIPLTPVKTDIEIILATADDLGLKDDPSWLTLLNRARKLGLDPVPAEVGPQLRLQYLNQPPGEWIVVAMKPVVNRSCCSDSFVIGNNNAHLVLDASGGHPPMNEIDLGNEWYLCRCYWAFTRRKQQ